MSVRVGLFHNRRTNELVFRFHLDRSTFVMSSVSNLYEMNSSSNIFVSQTRVRDDLSFLGGGGGRLFTCPSVELTFYILKPVIR